MEMSREYLRNIPAQRHQEAVKERAKHIRHECYNPAAAGKTRCRVNVKLDGIGCHTYPPTPIVTGDDLVQELIRTMPGCKITYIPAPSENTGYNHSESIEIDWS
jgi:hypothetical protein